MMRNKFYEKKIVNGNFCILYKYSFLKVVFTFVNIADTDISKNYQRRTCAWGSEKMWFKETGTRKGKW